MDSERYDPSELNKMLQRVIKKKREDALDNTPSYMKSPGLGYVLSRVPEANLSDEARLALLYWRFQIWQWDDLAGPKPEGFDEMKGFPTNFIQERFLSHHYKITYMRAKNSALRSIIGERKLNLYLTMFETLYGEKKGDNGGQK